MRSRDLDGMALDTQRLVMRATPRVVAQKEGLWTSDRE
jgi:hypothetical protein